MPNDMRYFRRGNLLL